MESHVRNGGVSTPHKLIYSGQNSWVAICRGAAEQVQQPLFDPFRMLLERTCSRGPPMVTSSGYQTFVS